MISLNILIIICSVQINITLPLSSIYSVVQLLSHVWLFATPWIAVRQASPWRRQWQPTPVLLPGKSHGWRSLVGCSPWCCWESDMTERLQLYFTLSFTGEGNGNPLQCSCLENPRDGGGWWAAVYGVTQSQTRLKWLSSSRLLLPPLSSLVCPT